MRLNDAASKHLLKGASVSQPGNAQILRRCANGRSTKPKMDAAHRRRVGLHWLWLESNTYLPLRPGDAG
jgi:hypothetical protein